jgi:hypothetical protein
MRRTPCRRDGIRQSPLYRQAVKSFHFRERKHCPMWLDDADIRKTTQHLSYERSSPAHRFFPLLFHVAWHSPAGLTSLVIPSHQVFNERSGALPPILSVQALQFVFEIVRDHASVHLLGSRVLDTSRLISAIGDGYLRRLLTVLCVGYVLRRTHGMSEPPHFVQDHGAHVWHLVHALKGKVECCGTLRLVCGVVPD